MCSMRLLFVVGILCSLCTCTSDNDPAPDEETLVIKTYQEMLDCHDNKNYDFDKAKKGLIGTWGLKKMRLTDLTFLDEEDLPSWSLELDEDWSGTWIRNDTIYEGRWIIRGRYDERIVFDIHDTDGTRLGYDYSMFLCDNQLMIIESYATIVGPTEWYIRE